MKKSKKSIFKKVALAVGLGLGTIGVIATTKTNNKSHDEELEKLTEFVVNHDETVKISKEKRDSMINYRELPDSAKQQKTR